MAGAVGATPDELTVAGRSDAAAYLRDANTARDLQRRLAAQDLKPNTIVQIHRILSRALKVAWKRGQLARNVAHLIDAPVGEDVDIEPLSQEEARQLLRAAANRRNGARWPAALAVGIRQSEAISQRWHYVDLDAGTIEVGWQLHHTRA
ncbi:MAG TPA: hypothetical protein VNF47_07210 [Streptosporangiaceae bacterium]|nr:hypothetical protein [Streptosporangiaceae bacterium]